MTRNQWALLICLIVTLTSYQNCGPAPKSAGIATSPSQNAFLTVAPAIDCRINELNGTLVRRVRSYSSNASSLQTLLEDQSYALDCSSSGLSDGTEAHLSFQLSGSGQPSGTATSTNGVFDLRYDQAGTYPMELQAIDSATGRSTRLSFLIDVRCSEDSTLDVSAAQINVTPKSTQGFFDFAASGVTGGVGAYQYAWDFNGDQRTDQQPVGGAWTLWSTQPQASSVFSMFAGSRNVNLYVRDACNAVKQVTKAKNFALPWETSPIKPADSTYYVQGKIRPLNPSAPEVWTQADLSARQPATIPDQRIRVVCSYPKVAAAAKRVLSVVAQNTYGTSSQVALTHGLNFKIGNIWDDGAMGNVNLSGGVPVVQETNYLVSETGDIAPGMRYSQNQSCTLQSLEVMRKIGSATCDGEPTNPSKVVELHGHFSCPSLRSSDGKTVQLNEVMFYCEAGDVQHCIGGPGGSGPGDPIPGW